MRDDGPGSVEAGNTCEVRGAVGKDDSIYWDDDLITMHLLLYGGASSSMGYSK